MMMTLSLRQLKNIGLTISNGSPLWGLLTANEYLSPQSLLRKAMVQKALKTIRRDTSYTVINKTVTQILQGKTFGELDLQTQARLYSIENLQTRSDKFHFRAGKRVSHCIRKQRLNNLLEAA